MVRRFRRAQFTINEVNRCSAANAFLKPVLSRPNLALIARRRRRILFEGSKAVGLEYQQGGVVERFMPTVRSSSVAGFSIAASLVLSGIGPAKHLRDHGINVLHDLPGVGANLQDHGRHDQLPPQVAGPLPQQDAVRSNGDGDAAGSFLRRGS